MPGKPITVSESEYTVLSQAKAAYEKSEGKSADWGKFLLLLLGLYIVQQVTKTENNKQGAGKDSNE